MGRLLAITKDLNDCRIKLTDIILHFGCLVLIVNYYVMPLELLNIGSDGIIRRVKREIKWEEENGFPER